VHILRNATNGKVLATRVARASNFVTRGLGLLPCATVAPDQGMWIDGCSAVHTIGMRATIDLYFLDKDNRVLRIVSAIPPNRLAVSCRDAVSIVELGSGPELGRDILVGDQLVLE